MWGLGWPNAPAVGATTSLEASTTGGLGGAGDWGAGGIAGGGGGGSGSRGRGGGTGGVGGVAGRGSAESAMGAREAHTMEMAQAQVSLKATTVSIFPEIVEALSCYKRIHGHVKVEPNFRVPMSAPWPETLQGMELGKRVREIMIMSYLEGDRSYRLLRLFLGCDFLFVVLFHFYFVIYGALVFHRPLLCSDSGMARVSL